MDHRGGSGTVAGAILGCVSAVQPASPSVTPCSSTFLLPPPKIKLVRGGLQNPVITPTLLRGYTDLFSDFQLETVDGVGHWIVEQRPELVLDRLRVPGCELIGSSTSIGTWPYPVAGPRVSKVVRYVGVARAICTCRLANGDTILT